MARFKLTERAEGTFYLQCRCAEIGRPCQYQGAVEFAPSGLTLLRQARNEAFAHCWAEHQIAAWQVQFDVSYYVAPAERPSASDLQPLVVTTEPESHICERIPQKAVPEVIDVRKKAGA